MRIFIRILKITSAIILIFCGSYGYSQTTVKKQLSAVRISSPPKIDGLTDDEVWKDLPVATNFIVYEPDNGKPSTQRSEVKITYDNTAIYVCATLYDSSPDSIMAELSKRDDPDVNTDYFGIVISPFNDGMNAVGFIVTAAGVQCDIKYSADDEDPDWNSVWLSASKINANGWSVEMKIPYSAIRFSNVPEQVWGLNFIRQVRRIREISFWNFIDKEKEGTINQGGELTGISDIKPPLRLSVTPYISGYLEKGAETAEWGYTANGGLDLKYGINESFTLDMTLIPDFGQVQSDDEVLNLTPFETYYGENRPFFTEGTELFNKGEIFYSRRIGAEPMNLSNASNQLQPGDVIVSNPAETRLINATKVSGRTNGELGIGFFNAMTNPAYATLADSVGNKRKVETQPFTNYNMLVLDQSLGNNSYISLLNTDVAMKNYTANVSGTTFNLKNKKNSFYFGGSGFISQKYLPGNNSDLGYTYDLSTGKSSGNFRWNVSHGLLDNKYDPNDMGYLQNNNEINNSAGIEYNIYKPVWKVLDWYNGLSISYNSLFRPGDFVSWSINMSSRTTFKNYLSAGLNFNVMPAGYKDYYEPRVEGRFYKTPAHFQASFWLSPDYRKVFLVDFTGGGHKIFSEKQGSVWYQLGPRIRFSNRMLLVYNFNHNLSFNDKGYADQMADTVYFGKRNITTLTNTISTGYIFNNKSSLSLRLRYYWSTAVYNTYYSLNDDGSLSGSSYTGNHDINFNAFTLDLNYVWNFAPGSEMTVVWKNSIFTSGNEVARIFINNIQNTFDSPQTNSFSLKILYYLDYQYLMKKK